MPAGVAVWQPYSAVGTKGLGDMWQAGQNGCRGRWEVEGGVWLRSNNVGCLVRTRGDAAVVEAAVAHTWMERRDRRDNT
jgi:hypothetical protein